MRVLVVGRSFYPNIGGVESSLDYISHAFAAKGHSVTILTSLLDVEQKEEELWDSGIKIIRVPISGKGMRNITIAQTAVLPFYLLKKFKRYINKIEDDYDLVICRDTVFAHLLGNKYGINKVIYIPAVVMKNYRWKINCKRFRKMISDIVMYMQISCDWILQKRCLNKFKCVVFSHNMKSQIAKILGSEKNIRVIYPGNKYYGTSYKNKEKKDICSLLYVGRVDVEKNVDLLLKAYSKCKNLVRSQLYIVGEGNKLSECKSLTKNMKISDNVFFLGKHYDMSKYYNDANYLVLPTRYEAFGFVMAEAQAFGTPVIGFKNNGKDVLVAIDEIIKDGYNGYVCEQYLEECLTETIDKAIDVFFTDKYLDMSKNSKYVSDINFSWDIFIDKILAYNNEVQ